MYGQCPKLKDAEVRAALAYFAVTGTWSSLTMRHVCASIEELKEEGITDAVLLPCFAAVLAKERSLISLCEMSGGSALSAEHDAELREEALSVITAVVNLQIGQFAPSRSPLCSLCNARRREPAVDPSELRRTLVTMYDVRHDSDYLRAVHDAFTGLH